MTSWGDGLLLSLSPVRYLSKADMVVEQHSKCNLMFGEYTLKLHPSQSCASLKNKRLTITWVNIYLLLLSSHQYCLLIIELIVYLIFREMEEVHLHLIKKLLELFLYVA